MALFLPGPLVAGISGTLSGMNFANTAAGLVIRKPLRRTTRHGASSLQQRARFFFLLHLWRSLSDADRTLWRTAARDLPRQNALGITRALSGFQLFLSLNLGPFAPPHADWTTPPTAQRSPQPETLQANFALGASTFIAQTKAAPPALSYQAYYGQRSFRSSPTFHPNRWTHLVTQLSSLDTLNLYVPWVALIGLPDQGEHIAIKIWRKDNTFFPAAPVSALGIVAA